MPALFTRLGRSAEFPSYLSRRAIIRDSHVDLAGFAQDTLNRSFICHVSADRDNRTVAGCVARRVARLETFLPHFIELVDSASSNDHISTAAGKENGG